ncbi:MAG: DUF2267 domain-containing protein [Rubritepida sp.]|nr:DUF2267 domain-containing protein [Rubritepida sp.]
MATTGLEVWDKTVQTTNIWLDEIMAELGPDRQAAWHALGAVLRALRDRLPIEVAAHLGAQLPLVVRGTFYDQWHVGGAQVPARSLEAFLAQVEAHFGRGQPTDTQAMLAAVFRTLARHVEPGQIAKVLAALPAGVRAPLRDAASA